MAATEKQIKEAWIRMEQLIDAFNLNENLMRYLMEGRICYSYMVSGAFGCIGTIGYNPSYAKICKEFEEETGAYVYHVIETDTTFGTMIALLYVSPETCEEEWEMDRLESNYIIAYVYNLKYESGEYGDVFLASDNGALVRIE